MRSICAFALFVLCGTTNAATALVVYDNALENGFNDRSWSTTYSLTNTNPVHSGTKSISFAASGYEGLQFVADNIEFNVIDYQSATFWIDGGSAGGQSLDVYIADNYGQVGTKVSLNSGITGGGAIPKNTWTQVTIDFNSIGLVSGTFNGIIIQDNSGGAGQPPVYIDDVEFNPSNAPPPGPISVNVDVTSNVRAIDPRIFGVAYGDATRNAQMGYTVRRWGGNSTTRYNWQVDVHSTAQDYYWENIPDCTAASCTGTPPVGNSADTFITEAQSGGAQPLIAIPTIGWTPRADSPHVHPYFAGFSVQKYGTQEPLNGNPAVDPYDTDAGSGECSPAHNTSPNCVLYDTDNNLYHLVNNNPQDTSTAITSTFEKQWIAHLQSTFGNAATTGVKMYSLDNEVMLWNSTHRDVHPDPPTYDEIWSKAADYGAAIKAQDPSALVTGPVTWGYPDLFSSAQDSANCDCIEGSTDRANHGGLAFVAWYLQQVCANPLAGGMHVVDYLDLHYYPQGTNVALNDDDSPATAARRLKSLREMYDSTWVSDSWIGTLGDNDSNHYDKPNLIPRVRAWIDQYCPGTKLAITEYNWGNDNTSSGAVAQAELLAIFAREGVDMATRWVAPDPNTKAERGYQILLNYDSAGSNVVGDSVAATTSDINQVGAYAFHGSGNAMVLLTNKDTVSHDVAVTFNSPRNATWTLYGFDGDNAVHMITSGTITGSSLTVSGLTPISANLLVIPDNDEIFKNGFQ